jgi:hypothetical protein
VAKEAPQAPKHRNLGILGLVLLIEGDLTARVIGAVMIVWALVLIVLWRKRIFFMFSARDP